MSERCEICATKTGAVHTVAPENDTMLCATCTRFIRLARERKRDGWLETAIDMIEAVSRGDPGFLEPDHWLPEEIGTLDKMDSLSEARTRMEWLSLGQSFRTITTPEDTQ